MNIIMGGTGTNSNIQTQVDPSFQSQRTSVRPLEYAPVNGPLGGHYGIGMMTGLMAAGIASAAQVFQMRWADNTRFFILKKLTVQCSTATGFAATTVGAPLELIIGHGSTASGSGGAAAAPTSISNKMRQNMASTAFLTSGEVRIATTAALTAATGQVLEAAPISGCMGADNRTLVSTPVMNLFEQRDAGDHPLVLNTGDTLVVRTNSPAATGTWQAYFTMDWLEVVQF